MYGLKERTIEQIQTVFANFPELEQAVLYGSRAKGDFKPGSDIDLTLYGNGLTRKMLYKLENELDDLLLPYAFDLSIFANLVDADLVAHIRRVGVVFYQKNAKTSSCPTDCVALPSTETRPASLAT